MRGRKIFVVCLATVLVSLNLFADEMRLMWGAKVDLNGDGKVETVKLTKNVCKMSAAGPAL
ncbi:MAG: hypothetical protein ACUVTP_10995 [Candidatus Fervidibacter sp.]|uniref:hypothetical protein n=1 Tax=Candidatus Fervidibacter sp. TaxID=3100871 RepID=UPI00404A20CC